jgi:hypothetical protein
VATNGEAEEEAVGVGVEGGEEEEEEEVGKGRALTKSHTAPKHTKAMSCCWAPHRMNTFKKYNQPFGICLTLLMNSCAS